MRELEHKREIERLWQEKLLIYKAQREAEHREQESHEAAGQLPRVGGGIGWQQWIVHGKVFR